MSDRWSCTHWKAWYNDQPGPEPDPKLYVSADCTFSSGSIRHDLRPANEGVIDDPDVFVLQFDVDDPGHGTSDFVEKTISWSGDVGRDIKRIE
ncbi:MAG TPA: hypothetical protein VGR12_02380 [Solirubrobacteraceae bacterium]|nr:hypothetical protein [Solirubrobacteraceae bacterium]